MKYSIRGNLSTTDQESVVNVINNYTLWRFLPISSTDENGNPTYSFEVWLDSSDAKDELFNNLKPFVDQYGELINWHECTHDEPNPQPCTIAEEYRR